MPKRLAVTIAGAVSLGSYEAGVLYEVLDAIRQHNRNPATAESDHITIDVLTGASAGGMTAVILAQKLMLQRGPVPRCLQQSALQHLGETNFARGTAIP